MLHSIGASSLKSKLLVLGLAAAVIAIGAAKLRYAPVDVLPEFSPSYVEIQTEARGLSAEEVEQLVTLGLEQDLPNGVPWLRSILFVLPALYVRYGFDREPELELGAVPATMD